MGKAGLIIFDGHEQYLVKMRRILQILCMGLCMGPALVRAQQAPFQSEIDAFRRLDSLQRPPAQPILFAGSSSIRGWKTLAQDFQGYPVLNRGFGGSSLPDLIRFVHETIVQYNPRQVYIYCGENDLAASDTVTPRMVRDRFRQLYRILRHSLAPRTPIVFLSIKPSVARWQLQDRFIETNRLIRAFISKKRKVSYVDVHSPMLDATRNVRPELFIADNLHMNAAGYAIWTSVIAPTLHL